MGCGTSKPAPSARADPVRSATDARIEARLSPMLSPSHDLNVNKKYTFMIKLLPDQTAGDGFKKTPAFVSLVPQEVLTQKKAEFWGELTRVPRGRPAPVLGGPQTGRALQRQRWDHQSLPWTPCAPSV